MDNLPTQALMKLLDEKLPPSLEKVLQEQLRRKIKNPNGLADWTKVALHPFNQVPASHHKLLINKLQLVAERKIKRLMIFWPPGSGKSTYSTVLFPCWLFANTMNLNILGASHTADLAEDFSKRIQGFVTEHKDILGYSLTNSAANLWATSNGGRYRAAGVGGPIAGFRSDLALIDDPVKNRKDADSPTYRDTAYNWFRADVLPRLRPNAAVIIIQCMVGSTKVLMSDGNTKELKDIKIGDNVATYNDGLLDSSKINNWTNQGKDDIYEIQTCNGFKTRANKRHPFLIERNGKRQWIKIQEMEKGDLIFRFSQLDQSDLKKDHSKESNVLKNLVICQQDAVASAILTTIKPDGRLGIEHQVSILKVKKKPTLNIDMESITKNTQSFSKNKMEFVRSVKTNQSTLTQNTGNQNFASITITQQERCEDCSATDAICLCRKTTAKNFSKQQQNISEFIVDKISNIVYCGREDVFDIEVNKTENFIADGFVSHNTRWHEDDLSGRLLQDNPDIWDVLNLPAIAMDENDPLGRNIGEPLWNDDPNYEYGKLLLDIRQEQGERDWWSLYQQSPRPMSGGIFKTEKIIHLDAAPAGIPMVRAWDLASTAATGGRDPDWTAGALIGRTPQGGFVLADVVHLRGGPDDVEAAIVATASRDGRRVTISLPQDPGQAGASQVLYLTRKLSGYKVHVSRETGDKATRAAPFASQVNVGNVSFVKAAWNKAALNEMAAFPGGSHDDIIDACSRGFDLVHDTSAADAFAALAS